MITRYVLPLVAVVSLAFAISQMVKAQQKVPPVNSVEPGRSPYARQLAGAGIIEPETENIHIGSHVPGIVEKVYVKVGQTVKPGERLFQLDDRQWQSELRVREALLLNAERTLEKLEKTPRSEERPGNEARVREAEVNLEDLSISYERLKSLAKSNAISADEMTRKQMAVELAKAQLARARADFKLWEAGAWGPDREIARAAVLQAKAQLNQTQIEIARLTAKAPHTRWKLDAEQREVPDDAGVEFKVLQVNIRPGEYVANLGSTPLIVLGYVGRLHVRVDLDENDIARFRPELPGVAKPRGNPNVSYGLKFVRVEPYVIPKRSLTGANTERVDTRVLQVIYSLDTRGNGLYVGQQVDVYFDDTE